MEWRRMTEVTQTLRRGRGEDIRMQLVGQRGKGDTYNPPRAKTPINANFCRFGMFRDLSMGMGIPKMTASVRMFNAALENQKASSLKQ